MSVSNNVEASLDTDRISTAQLLFFFPVSYYPSPSAIHPLILGTSCKLIERAFSSPVKWSDVWFQIYYHIFFSRMQSFCCGDRPLWIWIIIASGFTVELMCSHSHIKVTAKTFCSAGLRCRLDGSRRTRLATLLPGNDIHAWWVSLYLLFLSCSTDRGCPHVHLQWHYRSIIQHEYVRDICSLTEALNS